MQLFSLTNIILHIYRQCVCVLQMNIFLNTYDLKISKQEKKTEVEGKVLFLNPSILSLGNDFSRNKACHLHELFFGNSLL